MATTEDMLVSQPLFPPGQEWKYIGLQKDGAVLDDTSTIISGLEDPTKTRLGTAGWWEVQTTRRKAVAAVDTEGGTRPLDQPTFQMLQLYAADMFTLYDALSRASLLESVGVKVDAPDGVQSPTPFAWTDTGMSDKVVAGSTLVVETRAALLAVVYHGVHQARHVLGHIDTPEVTSDIPIPAVVDVLSEGMATIKAVLKPAILAVNTLQSDVLASNSCECHHELEPTNLAAVADFVTALRFFAHTMHAACAPPTEAAAASPTALRAGLLATVALYSGTQAARAFEDDDADEDSVVVDPSVLATAVDSMVAGADKAIVLMTRANTTALPEPMRTVATNTARVLCWLKGFALCISSLAKDASKAPTCHANLLEIKREATPVWKALVIPGIGTCRGYCDIAFATPGKPGTASEAWLTKRATPETRPATLETSLGAIKTIVRCRGVTLAQGLYVTGK